jgi:hypothetical protein
MHHVGVPPLDVQQEGKLRDLWQGACCLLHRKGAAMTVLVEPFASVYDDRSRLGIILARGRGGFEAYAADDHSLGLFPSPRKAAAAITTTRPWVAPTTAEDKPERSQQLKALRQPWNNVRDPCPRDGYRR